MADETRKLANFVAALQYDQVPPHVRARAVDNLVDQIGCEIGGAGLPWARQVRDTYVRTNCTPAEATVVRYGDRIPANAAALINSTFGHSFEYDDVNPPYLGHPGAELIPPLMAIAECNHVSGREFLTAFIAAYEVRGRIGGALAPEMLEHGGPAPSTTCGPFGVAAGVGRLLGLGAEGLRDALGIAGSFAGGLKQYDHGGGSVKRIHTGIAASNGIQAARLAQAGTTGPEEILEGSHGLLRIYSSAYRPEQLVADLGAVWPIERVLFKPYSCCAIIHPAIDGLRMLAQANGIKPHDIDSIEVGYTTRSYNHAGITSPHDILGMQFSTSYSLALTMLRGKNTPREYSEAALADPDIRSFASRVSIKEENSLGKLYPGRLPARVKVRTKSGGAYETLVTDAKGSPGKPLSSTEIDEKFRAQVSGVYGDATCETLLQALRNVATLADMATLPPMLVKGN